MIRKQKKGLSWLEFELLQPYSSVFHGVFLRNPQGAHCLDFQKKIKECASAKFLALGKQTHEDAIYEIDDPEAIKDKSCDGLFTSQKHMALGVMHADCQAVILYDPKTEVIANIHCGWRGNHHNILGKAVEKLQQVKHCHPADLLVCISPSLGPNHSQFLDYEDQWPPHFHHYQWKPYHFNLWKISEDQLKKAGVKASNIEIAQVCTFSQEEHFFSYRRDRTAQRNITVVTLITP